MTVLKNTLKHLLSNVVGVLPDCFMVLVIWLIFTHQITGNSWVTQDYLVFFILGVFISRPMLNIAVLVHGYRNLADILKSCIPLQSIMLPCRHRGSSSYIPVGDSTPGKVRCKAAGGLLFNILAFGIAWVIYRRETVNWLADSSQSPLAVYYTLHSGSTI